MSAIRSRHQKPSATKDQLEEKRLAAGQDAEEGGEKKGSKEGEQKGSKEEPPKEGEEPKAGSKEGEKKGSKEGDKKDKEAEGKGGSKEGEKKETPSKGSKEGGEGSDAKGSSESKTSGSKGAGDVSKQGEGRMTGALAFAILSVTLGSFQFGYNIGCVNAPGEMITLWIIDSHSKLFNSTLSKEQADTVWSAIVSAFPFGGAVGGLLSGMLADKAGRKGGLLYTNIFSLVAAVLMGGAKPVGFYPMMMLGRFLVGIYAGLSVLCPIYLTEVSPTNLRGAIGSAHQLVITIAILVSQIVGLKFIFGTTDRWPLIFWFIVVPAILQSVLLQFVPESPKFTLCIRGNTEQATKDLEKLRGSDDVGAEIELLNHEAEANKEGSASKPTMGDMFKEPLKWPMTIAIFLMLMQQLSGINAVMFYSTVIFKTAGLSDEAAVYATIAMGTVNVLMTIVSVWLVDHPSAGRRSLLIIGLIGMWITTVMLTVCITLSMGGAKWASYGAIAFVLLYVVSFAAGAGSIPWFFVSEIFHSNARANANSIATMTNWGANIFVSMTFLPLNNTIKQYSILVFTVCLTVSLLFTWKYVPETKGKTTDEITEELAKK
ncbi:hypothetical protein Q1695_011742 [Nippostrongylus brasiliensis]|nr:hypothetical protein Q1695_011742 [Nippostrongylus brasiliensis]